MRAKARSRPAPGQPGWRERQDELRAQSKDLYLEPHLWVASVSRGAAVAAPSSAIPIRSSRSSSAYIDMGFRAFILTGYPHLEECDRFARYVLPRLPRARLNELQGRLVQDPITPLTTASRQ